MSISTGEDPKASMTDVRLLVSNRRLPHPWTTLDPLKDGSIAVTHVVAPELVRSNALPSPTNSTLGLIKLRRMGQFVRRLNGGVTVRPELNISPSSNLAPCLGSVRSCLSDHQIEHAPVFLSTFPFQRRHAPGYPHPTRACQAQPSVSGSSSLSLARGRTG